MMPTSGAVVAIGELLKRRGARGKEERCGRRLTGFGTGDSFRGHMSIMKLGSSRWASGLVTAGLAVVVLAVTGCSTIVLDQQGEMEATYVAGEFRMLMNGTAPATAAATSSAFKQLGLFEVGNGQQTYKATLAARTSTDEKVTVNIAEVNSRQTMIRIRVDVLGDRVFSQKLYQQIEKNLSTRGGW
jgi:Protein of unknown function (DUF3568)